MKNKILDSVNKYYTEKIKEHGISPKGVDWNSLESQELRFEQLCKVINEKEKFSILDYGCGYGALLEYMNRSGYSDFAYSGFDISEEMIAEAKRNSHSTSNVVFETILPGDSIFDYTIASGIFNVKLDNSKEDWTNYIEKSLQNINRYSKKGFSFNILTSYSDKEYMRDYLYYADPGYFFNYCKQHFSKYVALLHDYPLYEFTIIVKK